MKGILATATLAVVVVSRPVGAQSLPPGGTFVDDDGNTHEGNIEAIAATGITKGCNPPDNDRYCPNDPVTRGQMAPDNAWNTPVDGLPVHSRSAEYVAAIGATAGLHPDFGSGVWPPGSSSPIGIPYIEVDDSQPGVDITFTAYGDESDPGPYPVPAFAPIEGGPAGSGDRHVIVVDTTDCALYELFDAWPKPDGSWEAASGAAYDLTSNALRPEGWTSADAAGLPIFPGLVRYEEVVTGEIAHALRFTAPATQKAHVWPARHDASSSTDVGLPPMGQRFRLRADFDISGFAPEVKVILQGMKTYGLILGDNGAPWFVSGAPDDRWDNDTLAELKSVPGSAFEAVDISSLIIDPDSGATASGG